MAPAINPERGGSTILVLSRKTPESPVVGGSEGFERALNVTVFEIKNGRAHRRR